MQLLQSLIWLLAGVGVFIVGMNFMSEALEKSAGEGMKRLLGKISNNRFSGVGVGAGVTAIIQSSSATSVMVIGLVNAGVMTLMQATPIIMGANIGTTITGVLVALKNDYFDMLMYLLAFVGVMLSFFKKEKIKILGLLFSGLGILFVGLNIMSSEQAFGNPLVESVFFDIFSVINFPLLLILIGVVFTALIQSSSAATGVVITMVGTGIIELNVALFIILGVNIGTCFTAILAAVGANANSKRVALIHITFNVIGTVFFAFIVWIFKEPIVRILVAVFPGNDSMSQQMRVSLFHVIFNLTTPLILLPFISLLVKFSCILIKDKKTFDNINSFKFVDERLIAMPPVAIMQVKKEIEYMLELVEENISLSIDSMIKLKTENKDRIYKNETIIDFTNSELTKFIIKLSSFLEQSEEKVVGSYFHVLNDLERIGDHAENFFEIGEEMLAKEILFSKKAQEDIIAMKNTIMCMINITKETFESLNKDKLFKLAALENRIDEMKKTFLANHFVRLTEGKCSMQVSPYYSSVVTGLERVADHIVNVGFSIINPIGSQRDA